MPDGLVWYWYGYKLPSLGYQSYADNCGAGDGWNSFPAVAPSVTANTNSYSISISCSVSSGDRVSYSVGVIDFDPGIDISTYTKVNIMQGGGLPGASGGDATFTKNFAHAQGSTDYTYSSVTTASSKTLTNDATKLCLIVNQNNRQTQSGKFQGGYLTGIWCD